MTQGYPDIAMRQCKGVEIVKSRGKKFVARARFLYEIDIYFPSNIDDVINRKNGVEAKEAL
ncbi:MAG: hypothetical protein NTAFB09_27960 [Nitrosospira sp.]